MQSLRYMCLIAALGLACGEKDDTTATGSSETGATSSTTEPPATTTTGEEPTTSGTSTTGASSTSSGDAESSSGEPVVCDTSPSSCGVTETDVDSFCTDPPPASDTLVLETPGPGLLKISEVGYDQSMAVKVVPQVQFGPNNSILISYEIQGQPDDNLCKFTITTTLNNVPSGKWTVYLGPFQESVEVP